MLALAAGEGLDFLEDFGLGDVQEVTGLDNEIDKEAPPLDELDVTLTKDNEDKEQEKAEQEKADQAVADAVAEIIDDQPTIDFQKEKETTQVEVPEAVVPEQQTGLFILFFVSNIFFKKKLPLSIESFSIVNHFLYTYNKTAF